MIDTNLLRKKWNTEKPEPKKAVKKTVKKPAVKKTVKKPVKKKSVDKTTEKPEKKQTPKKETIPPSSAAGYKPKDRTGEDPDSDNLSELAEQAAEAKLREQISKADLAAYKVEKEALDLKKKAGDVAEVTYMEFVYISHIEKMYMDLLRMIDKITPKLNPIVQDKNTAGVTKLLKKEVMDTIRAVKKGQIEAVKSWKKDLREK